MRCVGKANIPALGMTETLGVYAWGRDLATPEYPIAAPLDELQPGFELLLADDDGNEVVDGVRAQILLRGPTVAGLLQKVARSDAFDANGFCRTGDLGVRVGSRVFFAGRSHDMIKTSGANVSPASRGARIKSSSRGGSLPPRRSRDCSGHWWSDSYSRTLA